MLSVGFKYQCTGNERTKAFEMVMSNIPSTCPCIDIKLSMWRNYRLVILFIYVAARSMVGGFSRLDLRWVLVRYVVQQLCTGNAHGKTYKTVLCPAFHQTVQWYPVGVYTMWRSHCLNVCLYSGVSCHVVFWQQCTNNEHCKAKWCYICQTFYQTVQWHKRKRVSIPWLQLGWCWKGLAD